MVYNNRPFPNCFKPLFQSEDKCEAIEMKMLLYSRANNIIFFTTDVSHQPSFLKVRVLKLENGLSCLTSGDSTPKKPEYEHFAERIFIFVD